MWLTARYMAYFSLSPFPFKHNTYILVLDVCRSLANKEQKLGMCLINSSCERKEI